MQHFWYADAHSCLPLHGDTDINQLRLHYDAGVRYLSINVGMDMNPLPQIMTTIAGYRRQIAEADWLELADTAADIERIAATYHRWQKADNYHDEPAYSYAATTEEIARNDYVLTPGRYVGTAETEEDSEPFAEKMTRLTALLNEQFAQGAALEAQIKANLGELGYE